MQAVCGVWGFFWNRLRCWRLSRDIKFARLERGVVAVGGGVPCAGLGVGAGDGVGSWGVRLGCTGVAVGAALWNLLRL